MIFLFVFLFVDLFIPSILFTYLHCNSFSGHQCSFLLLGNTLHPILKVHFVEAVTVYQRSFHSNIVLMEENIKMHEDMGMYGPPVDLSFKNLKKMSGKIHHVFTVLT